VNLLFCMGIFLCGLAVIDRAASSAEVEDRAKLLSDLKEAHGIKVTSLKKEIGIQRKQVDQARAKETKLNKLKEGTPTASQARIINKQLDEAEKLHKDALDKIKTLNGEIAQENVQYEQDRRRIIVKHPMPDDPKFVEQDGMLLTADELKAREKLKVEHENLKAEHSSPEIAADKYIEGLLADGTLERATRTGSRPYQLTNGPPIKTSMFVFYQCRYVSQGGFVNDRQGSVIVSQAKDGLWYISTMSRISGIDFQ